MDVLVTGAGGALGGHLVKQLISDGHAVRAVDVKPLDRWWQSAAGAENVQADLSRRDEVKRAFDGVVFDRVYNLAANMGGIGFITACEADCAFTVLTTAHMLEEAADTGSGRFIQTSSACIYPTHMQDESLSRALREDDAWPALPDHGYGLEKLFGEKLCEYASRDWYLDTRVARLHNVYGTHGEWRGGREKAPAAMCRKIAVAKLRGEGEIEVWGDGEQTRSFMFVDDFVEGITRIAESDYTHPLNLGTSELVTINELISIVEDVAGYKVERRHNLEAPQGVRGRNSDNTRIREVLDWEPSISLREGVQQLYGWVEEQVRQTL